MTSSRERIVAACGLSFLVLLAVGPVVARAAQQGKKPSSRWSFKIHAEGEVRYDDNIVGLSEHEKDLVDPNDPNNVDRFRISSPEDVIFIPSLDFALARSPRKGRETSIFASFGSYQYVRNTMKDYQVYGLTVRQELNRSRKHRTALLVGGARTPSYFLRQLRDDDESTLAGMIVHNSAVFSRNEGFVELSQEIVNRYLSASGRYTRVRRDYEFHFNERDASANVERLEVEIYPLGKIAFRIRPYLEWEERTTRGDLTSTAVVDDDAGFDSNLWGLDLRGIWGRDADHRHSLRGYYENETREFTTDFTPDTGHFEREDDITKYGLAYGKEFGRHWAMDLRAYHRDNDVTFPGRPSTRFKKNVFAISLVYSLDHRFRGLESGTRELKDDGSGGF